MSDATSGPDLLNDLAHEFAERYRKGERPSLTEYAARYPALAADIRELFPALVVMEEFGSVGGRAPGPQAGPAATPAPERLGDYRILREVGRGGMGVVYEAEQESLGRHVALKVLPAHALLDPKHLQRFEREAKAAARLHHTNIVPVFGVGEDNGLHYYVMQFIQGQGLDQVLEELKHLRKNRAGAAEADRPAATQHAPAAQIAEALLTGRFSVGRLPSPPPPRGEGRVGAEQEAATPPPAPLAVAPPLSDGSTSILLPGRAEHSTLSESGREYWQSVARIGIQVAEALHYAHGQGILHRDIKPSNLLLDTRGTVWVTDFGLAKASDSDDLTQTGDIVGTLRYMAPERLQGQSDPRSDLYGLGITLYELLTLRPAFAEPDRNKLYQRVLHEEPRHPRQLNPEVQRDLETIVLKAIAKEPAQRYATAADLAEDLRRFLDDRPVKARRASWVERLWRWARRNKMAAALLATVGISVLLITGLSLAAVYRLNLVAYQAQQAADQARRSERDAKEGLFRSSFAQAPGAPPQRADGATLGRPGSPPARRRPCPVAQPPGRGAPAAAQRSDCLPGAARHAPRQGVGGLTPRVHWPGLRPLLRRVWPVLSRRQDQPPSPGRRRRGGFAPLPAPVRHSGGEDGAGHGEDGAGLQPPGQVPGGLAPVPEQ
jgi:serine/threonine protein kinase